MKTVLCGVFMVGVLLASASAFAAGRCSDGSTCGAAYSHCCYVNGTEQCVKSLSDCKDS